MAKFLTRLVMESATDQDDGQWVLVQDLLFLSDVAGRVIKVPKGFQTDLASVPRLPVIFWLTGAVANEAAVIHDYLYGSHLVDRATADAVLREASAVTGVAAWRRFLMYWGVRLGGASHWSPAASQG